MCFFKKKRKAQQDKDVRILPSPVTTSYVAQWVGVGSKSIKLLFRIVPIDAKLSWSELKLVSTAVNCRQNVD